MDRGGERKEGGESGVLSFCVQKGGEKKGEWKKKENKKNLKRYAGAGPWRSVFSSEDHGLPFSEPRGFFRCSRFLPGFLDFYSFIFCMRVWQRVR